MDKLRIVDWKRFWSAPKSALTPPTEEIASEIAVNAADAPSTVSTLTSSILRPAAPKPSVRDKFTEIFCPPLAPTKNLAEKSPFRISVVPNWESVEIRVISDLSAETSFCKATRSASELMPFCDWTASWRIRCNEDVTSPNAPSAVCVNEIASFAFLAAWSRPCTWVVKRSVICRPAASSAARLIRKPDERRSKEVFKLLAELNNWRCAFKDDTLVFTYKPMVFSYTLSPVFTGNRKS